MKNYIWVVIQSRMFNGEFWMVGYGTNKKELEKQLREDDYKWDSEQQLFINADESYWRKIEKVPIFVEREDD